MNKVEERKNMKSKKIVIWGTGVYGQRVYLGGGTIRAGLEVVAYTSSNTERWGHTIHNIPIVSPEQLTKMKYDCVFVAISHPKAYGEVLSTAEKYGLDTKKFVDIVFDPEYLEFFMDNRYAFIRDFSRKIYEEKIDGNVAECGVYRGESAKFINYYFPDRKIYLFDTFEGFAEKDLTAEKMLGNTAFNKSIFATTSVFTDTAVKYVLKKLKYPENAIIKRGYFPETASGLEDQFAFVNLDMDLYVPMLEGLRFFWPKLMQGGCILLHDYYHPELPGVKMAVMDFEKELGEMLLKFPIGDHCSIAVMKR